MPVRNVLLSSLLALFAVSTACAEVVEHVSEDFYVANARPWQSVTDVVNAASTIRQDGILYHGNTHWDLTWYMYWDTTDDGTCRMTRVVVTLKATVNIPRIFDATDAQRAEYERFIAGLREHERGHVEIARSAAHEIVTALEQLPPMPSCRALRERANETGIRIRNQGSERQVEYDRVTNHGQSQRAWPR